MICDVLFTFLLVVHHTLLGLGPVLLATVVNVILYPSAVGTQSSFRPQGMIQGILDDTLKVIVTKHPGEAIISCFHVLIH